MKQLNNGIYHYPRMFLLAAGPIPGPEAVRAGGDAAKLCRQAHEQGLEVWTDLPLQGIFLEGRPGGGLPDWQIIAGYYFGFAEAEAYFTSILPYACTVHLFLYGADPYQRALLDHVYHFCQDHGITLEYHLYGPVAKKRHRSPPSPPHQSA